jgi:ZIP family zinc transporter/zinc and cadmium transporter
VNETEVLYGLAAASANVLGALAVVTRTSWSLRALDTLLSLAAGFLISVAMIDLFPDALRVAGSVAAIVALLSYLTVHLTQHTLGRHFHFGEETHAVSQLVSVSALIGLLMHTFVDGVAVASGLRVSTGLGVLVFIAVLLHKFPEGLAISSLFIAAGAGRDKALLAACALGLMTVLGVVVTEQITFLHRYGLAISAGVTLYVGASNLVPELQDRRGWRIPGSFVAGCALYFVARQIASV